MDPYQAYLDLLEAVKQPDLEAARELAMSLRQWFARGGFTPLQCEKAAIEACIADVLDQATDGEAAFSLTCTYCDAGSEITSEAEAMNLGWEEVHFVTNLMEANHLGICPDCRHLEA